MAIEYTWNFNGIKVKPVQDKLTDVVVSYEWRRGAKDGDYFTDVYGSISLSDPDPKSFKKYKDLTKEDLTQPDVIEYLSKRFEVIGYNSIEELDQICLQKNIEFTYFIKFGLHDSYETKTSKNLIHAVFQVNDPHGHKYAYVSKWLSEACSGGKHDYVPHIVSLPPPSPEITVVS